MADQAALNGGRRVKIDSPISEGVIGNIADLGSDIANLADLQLKLAWIDLEETGRKAWAPALGLVAAIVFGLGGVPVLLFGVAELLAPAFASHGAALALTALGVLVLAGLIGGLAAWRLAHSFATLSRSRDELRRNLAWIKTALSQSGRPLPLR